MSSVPPSHPPSQSGRSLFTNVINTEDLEEGKKTLRSFESNKASTQADSSNKRMVSVVHEDDSGNIPFELKPATQKRGQYSEDSSDSSCPEANDCNGAGDGKNLEKTKLPDFLANGKVIKPQQPEHFPVLKGELVIPTNEPSSDCRLKSPIAKPGQEYDGTVDGCSEASGQEVKSAQLSEYEPERNDENNLSEQGQNMTLKPQLHDTLLQAEDLARRQIEIMAKEHEAELVKQAADRDLQARKIEYQKELIKKEIEIQRKDNELQEINAALKIKVDPPMAATYANSHKKSVPSYQQVNPAQQPEHAQVRKDENCTPENQPGLIDKPNLTSTLERPKSGWGDTFLGSIKAIGRNIGIGNATGNTSTEATDKQHDKLTAAEDLGKVAKLPSNVKPMKNADIVVMFVGLSGAGKSTACNMLCECDTFTVSDNVSSHTKEFESNRVVLGNGQSLAVIDTMGLCDTDDSPETIRMKITEALWHAKDGVDVIVFCIKQGKLDKLHEEAFETMISSIYGPECSEFLVLMITHMNPDYVLQSQDGHDWLLEQMKGDKSANKRMRYFNLMCHGRVVMVNYLPRSGVASLEQVYEEVRKQSRAHLLNMICDMGMKGRGRFVPLMARKAQEEYEKQRQAKLELERQREEANAARQREQQAKLAAMETELKAKNLEAEHVKREQEAAATIQAKEIERIQIEMKAKEREAERLRGEKTAEAQRQANNLDKTKAELREKEHQAEILKIQHAANAKLQAMQAEHQNQLFEREIEDLKRESELQNLNNKLEKERAEKELIKMKCEKECRVKESVNEQLRKTLRSKEGCNVM